jgi:muramoyltetrapeptide carboxypeptidase
MKMMKIEKQLKIKVISPSSSIKKDLILKSKNFIEEIGFKVKLSKNIFKRDGYLAGTDEERFEDLKDALIDENIDIVWMSRGGFGSIRLLEKLKKVKPQGKKIVIGYSDATSLFCYFHKFKNVRCLYGPSFSELWNKRSYRLNSLLNAIFLKPYFIKCKNESNILKEITIFGGCLSILNSLLGTQFFPELNGEFLFIEDVSEPNYKVERMLWQLKLAGVFDKIEGVILGSFSGESFNHKKLVSSVKEILGEEKIILSNLKCGHCNFKETIPMKERLSLDGNRLNFYYNLPS